MGSTAGLIIFTSRIHTKASLGIFETKKKPPRPSSEMDGEQSARRKHERPRTVLMSCLFIFHTYSVQPRGGGGSTRLLSRACLSAADHSGSAEEFSAVGLHEFLSILPFVAP